MKQQRVSTIIKKGIMLNTMEKSLSNISASTRFARISRDTHYRWLKEDSKYKEDIEEIMEKALDLAEYQLFKLISKGNTRAIMFYLNCKGKSRGYGKAPYKSIKEMPYRNTIKSKSTK